MDRENPVLANVVPLGPGLMIAGMTRLRHSREGGNPVLADAISLGPGQSRQVGSGKDAFLSPLHLPKKKNTARMPQTITVYSSPIVRDI